MKKLIPAIVMLLVSAVVLSTASYAWFTVSANVTASGMKVTASAPTSVVISNVATGEGKWGYTYNGWSSSIDFATADGANKLYAASSTTGVAFVAPEECLDVSGSAKPGTEFATVTNGASGSTQYYVDYTFAIKNTSPDTEVYLEIASIDLTGYALKDAVRLAVFVDNGEKASSPVAIGVYNPGSSNYVKVNGVAANGPISAPIAEVTGSDLTAWNSAAAGVTFDYTDLAKDVVILEAVEQEEITNADGDVISTTAEDNAHIITVRIWFEGQSAACISDYAGQNVGVSIQFKVGNKDA